MKVSYAYLTKQFAEIDNYLEDIRELVKSGDFTLGKAVAEFEQKFAELTGLPHAVAVGSGTDALLLSLKALGVGAGDEVITTPNTFVATVGAIAMTGARPVFVDNDATYTIDVDQIEAAITERTKAIMPVHLTGKPADMPAIMAVAEKRHIAVVEDGAQAILATIAGKHVGSWGDAAGFSLHPLKNLNVWGDGGIIVTRSVKMCEKLKLWRNHGLQNRDQAAFFAHNSRFDSLQALVANRLLPEVEQLTSKRIENAKFYDEAFAELAEFITLPARPQNMRQVFHTYVFQAKNRDGLATRLNKNGVRSKIHYPIPLHLQKAAEYLGYQKGDFPVCEKHCQNILSIPVHPYLTDEERQYVVEQTRAFYN